MAYPTLIFSPYFWLSVLMLSPTVHAQTSNNTTYPPVQVVDSPLEYRRGKQFAAIASEVAQHVQLSGAGQHDRHPCWRP
jgi:hypothetical protein